MSADISAMETGKFHVFKQFVSSAREFASTKNPKDLAAMNKQLSTIAGYEPTVFSPERLEVISLFGSLYDVMTLVGGPQWQATAVLIKAVKNPAAKHCIAHTFRFLPVLSNLLTSKDDLSSDKKIQMLSLLEVLTYGIKITWQESYIAPLLKFLYKMVMQYEASDDEPLSVRTLASLALTVMVNLCCNNPIVTRTLMAYVNTRELVKKLFTMKEGNIGAVQGCRLLMCLKELQGPTSPADVHNYLRITLQTFLRGIRDCDSTQLRHTSCFMEELCTETSTKSHIISYDPQGYEKPLQEVLKVTALMTTNTPESSICLKHTLSILTSLVRLELYSLRPFHSAIAELSVKCCHLPECLGPAFGLIAALVSQYFEEGMLSDDLMAAMSVGLTSLLLPGSLDAKAAGHQWFQLIEALCECSATQNTVVHNVKSEQFEEVLYEVTQHAAQSNHLSTPAVQDTVLTACKICLSLSQDSAHWDSALHRMLANTSIQKVLTLALTAPHHVRRKRVLDIVRHSHFPAERIYQVFCSPAVIQESMVSHELSATLCLPTPAPALPDPAGAWVPAMAFPVPQSPTLEQEVIIDQLILKVNQAFENSQNGDISASSLIELFGYKISCLEQQLSTSTSALQAATQNVGSLNHSLFLLQATSKNQQEVLLRTQTDNEMLRESVSRLTAQLNDASQSIRRFQMKLAAERLDREQQSANTHWEFTHKIKELETNMENKDKDLESYQQKLKEMEGSASSLQHKLSEQTKKNNELAGVLAKFEERIKKRDKDLEEASNQCANVKADLKLLEQTNRNLEKTLLERDKRLTQVTSQLEEMQRIQEVIASLMGNNAKNNSNASN